MTREPTDSSNVAIIAPRDEPFTKHFQLTRGFKCRLNIIQLLVECFGNDRPLLVAGSSRGAMMATLAAPIVLQQSCLEKLKSRIAASKHRGGFNAQPVRENRRVHATEIDRHPKISLIEIA